MEHKGYCTKCKTMTPAHIVGTKICAICYPNASEVSSLCCGEKIAELEKEVKSWRAWSAMHEDKAFQDLRVERDRLVAELARVKANSLRVVPMTEDRSPINIDTLVRHAYIDGRVVRLERWEDQDND